MAKPRAYRGDGEGDDDRFFKMLSKYDGRCKECGEGFREGELIVFDGKEKKAYCLDCGTDLL